MQINWKDERRANLSFGMLNEGDTFVIDTHSSRGAVYSKVVLTKQVLNDIPEVHVYGDYFAMLELATGKVFPATHSRVRKVKVSVSIDANKPNLEGY